MNVFSNIWWRGIAPHRFAQNLYYACKYAYQRVTRGYCDTDVWSWYAWFLEITPNMIHQLNAGHVGTPYNVSDEYWTETLTRLERLLREANEETSSKPEDYQYQKECLDGALTTIRTWFWDLWD